MVANHEILPVEGAVGVPVELEPLPRGEAQGARDRVHDLSTSADRVLEDLGIPLPDRRVGEAPRIGVDLQATLSRVVPLRPGVEVEAGVGEVVVAEVNLARRCGLLLPDTADRVAVRVQAIPERERDRLVSLDVAEVTLEEGHHIDARATVDGEGDPLLREQSQDEGQIRLAVLRRVDPLGVFPGELP